MRVRCARNVSSRIILQRCDCIQFANLCVNHTSQWILSQYGVCWCCRCQLSIVGLVLVAGDVTTETGWILPLRVNVWKENPSRKRQYSILSHSIVTLCRTLYSNISVFLDNIPFFHLSIEKWQISTWESLPLKLSDVGVNGCLPF